MLTIKEKLELTAAVTMLERLERALVRKRKAATALAGGARGDRGGRRTPGCTTADRPSRST